MISNIFLILFCFQTINRISYGHEDRIPSFTLEMLCLYESIITQYTCVYFVVIFCFPFNMYPFLDHHSYLYPCKGVCTPFFVETVGVKFCNNPKDDVKGVMMMYLSSLQQPTRLLKVTQLCVSTQRQMFCIVPF